MKIRHPYGYTNFKSVMKVNNNIYKLSEVFPNYGTFEGHKQAKNLAVQLREEGYFAIVVAKTNASGVYFRKR